MKIRTLGLLVGLYVILFVTQGVALVNGATAGRDIRAIANLAKFQSPAREDAK